MGMANWSRTSVFHAESDNEVSLTSSKIHNLSVGPIQDCEEGFLGRDPIAVAYQSTSDTLEVDQTN
jgi:hypothetical protein